MSEKVSTARIGDLSVATLVIKRHAEVVDFMNSLQTRMVEIAKDEIIRAALVSEVNFQDAVRKAVRAGNTRSR